MHAYCQVMNKEGLGMRVEFPAVLVKDSNISFLNKSVFNSRITQYHAYWKYTGSPYVGVPKGVCYIEGFHCIITWEYVECAVNPKPLKQGCFPYVTLELACAPTSPYMYNVMKKGDN